MACRSTDVTVKTKESTHYFVCGIIADSLLTSFLLEEFKLPIPYVPINIAKLLIHFYPTEVEQ